MFSAHTLPYRRKRNRHHHQSGFTLIEILVVVSLSVIITLAAAGLFFTTLISNSKKNVLTTIKDEGDYSLSQMEFLLRNAIALVPNPSSPASPTCTTGMSSITLKSYDGGTTTLSTQNNKIASQSAAAATPVYLTSTNTTLSGLSFNCEQASQNYGTYVTISFTLQKTSPDFNSPTPTQDTFTTSVNIRSY
jgi:prepilin-type N-terminal cleavage/methylation domain-containing protein